MELRYEVLLGEARDIILFIGQDGRIVEANPAASRAYGYSQDELRALSIRDLRDPDTEADIGAQMARALHEGLLFETSHRRKDGTTFPVEVSTKRIDEGRTLVSVIRDISERKRTEAELVRAREELEERVMERTRELEHANTTLRVQVEALEAARSIIELQAEELLERGAPILALREGLLLSPLVGPLDASRATRFATRVLSAIATSGARLLLLDVTGVSKLDSVAVRALLDVVAAAKLVGAGVIMTGIRAAAAMELATSGFDVADLSTYSTLSRGLAEALRRMHAGPRRAVDAAPSSSEETR
ncbi:PAS domain S-box protein [Polyangium sp. y55x31]|uniref:PAS domain S-box protein n=1 Tax=Polyangium sp. y55x31 TaxID=3042688 RepID=UPI00248236C9|nr:PAS domain S-box protein [Polyangium sp. y55x31]MDI1481300.1 PAS domain S-box protein [Polyangium sp. y55x31]